MNPRNGDPTAMPARPNTPSRGSSNPARPHQEGMALVLALLVLVVLTVIGAALMANVTTETKISGYKVRDTQALTVAEAGVQEAMLRIRNGDVVDDLNPTRVNVISTFRRSIPVMRLASREAPPGLCSGAMMRTRFGSTCTHAFCGSSVAWATYGTR